MSLNKLYGPKVTAAFSAGYAQAMAEAFISAMTIRTNLAGETIKAAWGSLVPPPTEWRGHRNVHRPIAREITVTNRDYQDAVQISIPALERDETGTLARYPAELARVMADHPWTLITDMIRNGATAGNTSYDGQTFFDTDHALGSSGAQKNIITENEVLALNIGTATDPTPEEAAPAILHSIAFMQGYVDEFGRPMLQDHRDWVVFCQNNLAGPFTTAVNANNLAGGESNIFGGLNVTVRAERRLYSNNSASAVFYIVAANHRTMAPFIFNVERDVNASIKDTDSEFAHDTNHIEFGVDMRCGVAYGEPLLISRCTLS